MRTYCTVHDYEDAHGGVETATYLVKTDNPTEARPLGWQRLRHDHEVEFAGAVLLATWVATNPAFGPEGRWPAAEPGQASHLASP